MWLRRAELLQSLLGYGIAASLDDIADKESSARLRDRLILEERYSMAVYTCKKCKVCMIYTQISILISVFLLSNVIILCKIDAFAVWNAWGLALIRMEHYAQARVKFKYVNLRFFHRSILVKPFCIKFFDYKLLIIVHRQALQLYKDDPAPVIQDIINTIEGGPPADVSSVRSM